MKELAHATALLVALCRVHGVCLAVSAMPAAGLAEAVLVGDDGEFELLELLHVVGGFEWAAHGGGGLVEAFRRLGKEVSLDTYC